MEGGAHIPEVIRLDRLAHGLWIGDIPPSLSATIVVGGLRGLWVDKVESRVLTTLLVSKLLIRLWPLGVRKQIVLQYTPGGPRVPKSEALETIEKFIANEPRAGESLANLPYSFVEGREGLAAEWRRRRRCNSSVAFRCGLNRQVDVGAILYSTPASSKAMRFQGMILHTPGVDPKSTFLFGGGTMTNTGAPDILRVMPSFFLACAYYNCMLGSQGGVRIAPYSASETNMVLSVPLNPLNRGSVVRDARRAGVLEREISYSQKSFQGIVMSLPKGRDREPGATVYGNGSTTIYGSMPRGAAISVVNNYVEPLVRLFPIIPDFDEDEALREIEAGRIESLQQKPRERLAPEEKERLSQLRMYRRLLDIRKQMFRHMGYGRSVYPPPGPQPTG